MKVPFIILQEILIMKKKHQKCFIFNCEAITESITTGYNQRCIAVYSEKIKRIYLITYEALKEICELYFDAVNTYLQVQPQLEQRFGEPIKKKCPEFSRDEAIKQFPKIFESVFKIVNLWDINLNNN